MTKVSREKSYINSEVIGKIVSVSKYGLRLALADRTTGWLNKSKNFIKEFTKDDVGKVAKVKTDDQGYVVDAQIVNDVVVPNTFEDLISKNGKKDAKTEYFERKDKRIAKLSVLSSSVAAVQAYYQLPPETRKSLSFKKFCERVIEASESFYEKFIENKEKENGEG